MCLQERERAGGREIDKERESKSVNVSSGKRERDCYRANLHIYGSQDQSLVLAFK